MRNNSTSSEERTRVLRIAHSSLTPALRDRERALARCYPDIDLQVLTTERWREAEVDVDVMPDDLFLVRSARTRFSKHIQLFAYETKPVIEALQEHRPHLIDINHEPYSVALAELLLLCQRHAPEVPIVMQTAQNIMHRYPLPFRWFEQRAFRRVSAAYACSETVREVLWAKGFKKSVSIIPFGVNTERFRPLTTPRSEKPLTIGFVGRMLPGKGLNILAEALGKLRAESWKLLVVGDGPERQNFTEKMSSFGLSNRVEITGAISYDDVPQQFHRMDVLVIPTQTTARIREQFGRVIVEAMASGVPVIGSTCGAIPEVIADAGLIFPEGESGALASAIRKVLSDQTSRYLMSIAGRARVEEHYTWNKVASETYNLFQNVLRATKQTAAQKSPNKVSIRTVDA
jgi:glycosyltransferase involved in cell wall biosynthesis